MDKISKIAILVLFALNIISCDEDNHTAVPQDGDILISSTLPNPDGFSGSAFMQIINNFSPSEYTNENAYQIGGVGAPPIVIGNHVFIIPGNTNETTDFQKYTWSDGKLELKSEYQLPTAASAVCCVTKGDKAYLSLRNLGKILILNHQTMTKIAELDISEYGVGDNNPDPAIMLIRDNLLYVPLNQVVGRTPDPKRKKVDVLIIDTETDQPVKMITDSTAGMSMPTRFEADYHSIFMDENKDIYINCVSGFGFLGHGAGFLRIKAGETDFDKDYSFDVTQTAVEGYNYKPAYILNVLYVGNGKLYATANINELYSVPEPNWFEDQSIICMEVDLKSKTLKKLDIPNSTNFGKCVGLYNDKIVFGIVTEKDAGFYEYDPSTGKASSSAIVKVTGYPFSFHHFGEK